MLRQLFAPQLVTLYVLVASTLYVHFRGKQRLRFARQLGDHSTYLAPYNVLMYAGSAVPNTPVIPVEQFPELKKLSDNWETIRDEATRLFDEGFIRAAAKNNDWGFYSFFKSGWKRFYLKWYDDFLPSARTLCPKTVELLNSIPNVHGAMFAMLPPGGKLGAHRDPFAGSLRYHLGLVTPNSNQCRILVDGVECVWRDGEAFMFDETFIHSAENKTDVNRIILFCDVERPMKVRLHDGDEPLGQPQHRQGVGDPERRRRACRRAEQGVRQALRDPSRQPQGQGVESERVLHAQIFRDRADPRPDRDVGAALIAEALPR
ncbi:beta-hydroxylase [Bradyrhizobium sp. USDA 4518]